MSTRSTKTGRYKIGIFLDSECSLFAKSEDREIDMKDFQEYEASPVFPGRTADVTWMNQQLFNVLAQKTRGTPFQCVELQLPKSRWSIFTISRTMLKASRWVVANFESPSWHRPESNSAQLFCEVVECWASYASSGSFDDMFLVEFAVPCSRRRNSPPSSCSAIGHLRQTHQ